jgi:hypothetical protein
MSDIIARLHRPSNDWWFIQDISDELLHQAQIVLESAHEALAPSYEQWLRKSPLSAEPNPAVFVSLVMMSSVVDKILKIGDVNWLETVESIEALSPRLQNNEPWWYVVVWLAEHHNTTSAFMWRLICVTVNDWRKELSDESFISVLENYIKTNRDTPDREYVAEWAPELDTLVYRKASTDDATDFVLRRLRPSLSPDEP